MDSFTVLNKLMRKLDEYYDALFQVYFIDAMSNMARLYKQLQQHEITRAYNKGKFYIYFFVTEK